MSAAVRTPGDRACQCALAAETVLRVFASKDESNWAWGLHQLSEDASIVALSAMESGDLDAIDAASLRYAKANAVFSKIAQESSEEMLLAAEVLLEATKDMIDAESARLVAKGAQA